MHFIFFTGCKGHPDSETQLYSANLNVIPCVDSVESIRLQDRWEEQRQEKADDALLKRILKAMGNGTCAAFSTDSCRLPEIRITEENNVTIREGYLFSKHTQHLLVGRDKGGDRLWDIYEKSDTGYVKKAAHQEWIMSYVRDTIEDVNGDGYSDFVVYGYGVSGCCLKAFCDVSIFLPESGRFGEPVFFLNPTFSPVDRAVRGVEYGHPGETSLYKFQWRESGTGVDTMEFISPDQEKSGGYVRYPYAPSDQRNAGKEKKLKYVPQEYVHIFGFDWFMGSF